MINLYIRLLEGIPNFHYFRARNSSAKRNIGRTAHGSSLSIFDRVINSLGNITEVDYIGDLPAECRPYIKSTDCVK